MSLRTAESQLDRGRMMKKKTRGLWSYLLGHGWCNTGGNG
jgi:hypothetical protein